ncbi:MAG: PQQ-dependent sugar dehydrogenase, partial [Bacteroidota bacterium]
DGNLLRVNLKDKTRQTIQGFPNDRADSIRVLDRRDNTGIFEIVLDPDFVNTSQVYISYAAQTEQGTTTKVIRARLVNNQLRQIKTLFLAEPFTSGLFHYGGGMAFGPDGKLYFTIGERLYNEIDEPPVPIAQDLTDRRGKIYRLNPDGSVPRDNPDFGPEAIPGMYAVGIRAAQGICVEPRSGKLWFSEHGTRQGDEINVLKGGANYGWPIITTGGYRSQDYVPPKMEGTDFSDPIWYWPHTVAPTGLCFYTGDEFPEWKNDLLVPGLSRGSLWRFRMEGEKIKSAEELFVDDRVRARKVVQSPEGKIYLLSDEKNGRIIRIKNAAYSDR